MNKITAIMEVLRSSGRPMTSREIAALIGRGDAPHLVAMSLKLLHDTHRVYVAEWLSYSRAVYALGNKPDAPRPAAVGKRHGVAPTPKPITPTAGELHALLAIYRMIPLGRPTGGRVHRLMF